MELPHVEISRKQKKPGIFLQEVLNTGLNVPFSGDRWRFIQTNCVSE